MAYVKSHSNYILKKKHQAINDGTVWERDITTIGGIDQFAPSQTPIYKSSNFIVTVRNDNGTNNQFSSVKWKENESGTTWTLATISAMSSDIEDESDLSIVLKQDYYDFRDFAYYGSLTELFRGSVTDIVNRFPGELYASTSNPPVYYTSSSTEDFDTITTYTRLGDSAYTEVSNPFGIDIHSQLKPSDGKEIKYFADSGYTNYEIFVGDSESGTPITSWTSKTYDNVPIRKGNHVADVQINGYKIEVWIGNNCEPFYLSKDIESLHIRPKEKFMTAFYNECDTMEKLLANPKKNYSTTFAVIKENDYGYYQVFETFTMPTSYGGYNVEPSESYIDRLVKIGEFYDERFTDNLYRSLTHEAIKNFDWTYTREYNNGDEEEYVNGGERIQKALRLFAREFDEIKSYIDALKDNGVSYNGRNNIPDYFLTDQVESDGWDVKLVHPYDLVETDLAKKVINDYSISNQINGQSAFTRSFSQSSKKEVTPYSINAKTADEQTKYGYFLTCCKDGFQLCQYQGSPYYFKSAKDSGTTYYDECRHALRDRIKKYTNEDTWTYANVNNEFLRRLLLNSKDIWRHKGTMDSIEMVLGLFGLKSKRWVNAQDGKCSKLVADYDMTEYTSFTKRVEEKWDAVHQMYRIDWLNSTKTIIYDNRSTSNYTLYGAQSNTIDYQGLPITYRDEYEGDGIASYIKVSPLEVGKLQETTCNSKEAFKRIDEANAPVLRRYLYPNFDPSEEIDGGVYFQMNGGWLSKTVKGGGKTYNFQFDVDNNIVVTDHMDSGSINSDGTIKDNCPLYKETLRHIKMVDNVASLLTQPYDELSKGEIVYVANIENNIMVIDGGVYTIHQEYNDSSSTPLKYVEFIKSDGYFVIGEDRYYDTNILVYDKSGDIQTYYVGDKPNGYVLKAYYFPSKSPSFVCQEDDDGNYAINGYTALDGDEGDSLTNYYVLDDETYASNIEVKDASGIVVTSGWRRLSTTDKEYLKINTILNYYNGNNPHDGNMVYDNGHEYFTYFNRLFKYASDNSLFDERCYEDYYYTSTEEIPTYGFSGLIESNELIKQYDTFLTKDSKIHYFGNYKKKDNSVYIYSCDPSKINGYESIYGKNKVTNYILNSSSMIGDNPYSSHKDKDVDEVTNQIVNNKRFTITFYLHDDWYTKQGQCELKYLDDVVMSYLTQVVPSTAIMDIKYEKR